MTFDAFFARTLRPASFAASLICLIVAAPHHAEAACSAYPAGVVSTNAVVGLADVGGSGVFTTKGNAVTAYGANGMEGMLVYDSTANILQICDGTNWQTLSTINAIAAAGSNGQIQFNSSGVLSADSGLNWDNTNKRLGIGTTSPGNKLEVRGGHAAVINEDQWRGFYSDTHGSVANWWSGYYIRNSRGTAAAPTATQANDNLGIVRWYGRGDTAWPIGSGSAEIQAEAEATFTDTAFPTALKFKTAGATGTASERMRITSGGNVGIGTTGPAAKLDVNGNILLSAATPTITFNSGGPAISVPAANTLTLSTSGLERMRIDNNGNVAIGTTSASQKLHVNGNIYANMGEGFRILGDVNYFGTAYDGIIFEQQDINATAGATDGGFVFRGYTTTDTTAKEWMVIRNPGNVGIGVASPGHPLTVGGSTGLASNALGGPMVVKVGTGDNATLGTHNVRIDTWYGLGFGSTCGTGSGCPDNTNAKLVMDMRTGDFTIAGTAYKPGGGSWTASSDARLKNVDGNYEAGLESILRLKPIRFHYRHNNPRGEPSDRAFVGLIAQDVQKVIPEAVSERGDGYLDLDTTAINFAFINAIKELKAANDNQAAELRALRDEFEKYTASHP